MKKKITSTGGAMVSWWVATLVFTLVSNHLINSDKCFCVAQTIGRGPKEPAAAEAGPQPAAAAEAGPQPAAAAAAGGGPQPAAAAAAGGVPKPGAAAAGSAGGGPVTLNATDKFVVMDNGILQVTINMPMGYVTGIRYNGLENVLDTKIEETDRGYWDVVWDLPVEICAKTDGCTDWVYGSNYTVIHADENIAEISFMHKWNTGNTSQLPLNLDRRYVMLRGVSGYYSYGILEREAGFPETNIFQMRTVYRPDKEKFHYMAVSDDRQRIMPMPQDRHTGQVLDYKEAVLLTNPVNPGQKGEVDDKYQYAMDDKDNKVHGWVSTDPPVGFWMITPSNEFRSAGPFKQDLTSHTGPITLNMFHSIHYSGNGLTMKFAKGEVWKMVYGPFFVYLNTGSPDPKALWKDAKAKMEEETAKWPYDFVQSPDFPKLNERGVVSGKLQVLDKHVKPTPVGASNAWVGLAPAAEPGAPPVPGELGSWQRDVKNYQFWVKADEEGAFVIRAVREGKYSLYATVPGFIGEYKHPEDIIIKPGADLKLGDLTYEPPRNGPTAWEIGFPDRTAAEFFIPDPNPLEVNKLLLNCPKDKFRHYGLWERYSEIYKTDLVYDVEKNDFHKDWYFAHVPRKGPAGLLPTTWQVSFNLATVVPNGNYTLQLAIASASEGEVQIRFNDPNAKKPHFTTLLIGEDNSIARHGIHGLHWLYTVPVDAAWLKPGPNTMFLTQPRCKSPFEGIMYDYIRLELPGDGAPAGGAAQPAAGAAAQPAAGGAAQPAAGGAAQPAAGGAALPLAGGAAKPGGGAVPA